MTALTLEAASRSETGRRSNNEDAVFFSPRIAAVALLLARTGCPT